MKIVALVPAYNESASIGTTIQAVLDQDRPADHVVVVPNGCTDDTAEVARGYPVTVMELPQLEHRKSEALNRAWARYAQDADMVVCIDADTWLPPHAFADWAQEFTDSPHLGGSSSKFTMQAPDLLSRLQKAEFATWTDTSLRRGTTHVLAGTGCAISGAAL
ncbi:glycosyltransferase family 2 protein, partial [Kocuria sp. NPDC057446]|uniref:glycosyltransferase family 2 protein n=1 Tax=Kocuria sp. NPDC057446 TaxID=3346137 RepID=UPI0036838F15